jgi:hypothetical protein
LHILSNKFSNLNLIQVTLLNLLSFSTNDIPSVEKYEQLLVNLDKLLDVKDDQSAEIVKFLQAILDKHIDILLDLKTRQVKDSNAIDEKVYDLHTNKIQIRVFEILMAIFQIIENQNKFASFRAVIDAYLSKNFCITLAHQPLLRIFNEILTNIIERFSKESSSTIMIESDASLTSGAHLTSKSISFSSTSYSRANVTSLSSNRHDEKFYNEIDTLKSMEYIFKFAFRSRELLSLYNRSNSSQSDLKEDSFDTDVNNIFNKLTQIVNLQSNSNMPGHLTLSIDNNSHVDLTKIQSYILKYSINLMPILINSKRYSMRKISQFFAGFLESRYILQTQFLSKMIKSKLFEFVESREVLVEPICNTISGLLMIQSVDDDKSKMYKHLDHVGRIIAEFMDVLEKKHVNFNFFYLN